LAETAYFFYTKVDDFSSDSLKIKYYSKSIPFYEKALSISSSEELKSESLKCYSNLSRAYLNNEEYLKAINSAKRGLEISNDISLNATLIVAYVMNNQYSEAETAITEARKDSDTYSVLSRGILGRIMRMEAADITHPDFERVKELLKN
jgi:tetratricopeptide (TPR) repeat protein